MAVRAIRGATQVAADDRGLILAATRELITSVVAQNQLQPEQLISVLFTSTPDLRAEFPAVAARELGLGDVPLLCMVEIAVPESLPRVVRLMMHVDVAHTRQQITHVYLHGAAALRLDIAQ